MSSLSRLFIALSLDAPWPSVFPEGKLLKETDRHLTLSFLGNQEEAICLAALEKAPTYRSSLAPCGVFDGCLFLPEQDPNVVSWSPHFDSGGDTLLSYQKDLELFLAQQKILTKQETRDWKPHVTLCRKPFDRDEWIQSFKPLPFVITGIALYKSLGNLSYQVLWTKPWTLPFEKLPHTADLAYIIRGKTIQELFRHAQLALSFVDPVFASYQPSQKKQILSIEDVVAELNRFITEEDTKAGCPMKAVSYHCDHLVKNGLIEWEMIIDV